VHGGVVCIFETHRKEEEVIDGERGFGLPGLRQTIVHLVSQSALQMWAHPHIKCSLVYFGVKITHAFNSTKHMNKSLFTE